MAFNKIQKYQKHFRKLVQMEREEEMRWHLREIRTYSPQHREKLGRAILHLAGKDAGRGLGGSYLVKFGRRKLPKTDISVGDLIICSTGRPSGEEMQATVIEKTGSSVTVAYGFLPPRYVYKRDLRIDLFANDITFQRMQEALSDLGKNQKIQNILLERQKFRLKDIPAIEFYNQNLNDSQQKAVENTLATPDFFLIHGPPGTGKTTTLVEAIMQHAKQGLQVLATADSNVAVDNMVEKLARYNSKVVRVGNPARVTKDLIEHTLDHIIAFHPHYKAAQDLWEKVDQLRDAQRDYVSAAGSNRRGFSDNQVKALARKGRASRGVPVDKLQSMAQWIRLQEEIKVLSDQAREYQAKAAIKILKEAEVICCTNSTAGSEIIDQYLQEIKGGFDVVFVDEASQSVEPACLIPIVKSSKFIMAGDHKQLPPTVLNMEAQLALQFTMFERILDRYGDEIRAMLKVQYRMHKKIMQFPNLALYEGKLKAHSSVAGHILADLNPDLSKLDTQPKYLQLALAPDLPAVFLNTALLPVKGELQRKGSTSYANEAEAVVAAQLISTFFDMGIEEKAIGVISPYDDQVDLLSEKLQQFEDLEIKTVDGFQGREKEIIIISFVRSNENQQIGFLNDVRRLNVAITRPKRKLIMIGDAETLSGNKVYAALLDEVPVIEVSELEEGSTSETDEE